MEDKGPIPTKCDEFIFKPTIESVRYKPPEPKDEQANRQNAVK